MRLQAIGGLAAIVTLGGLVLKSNFAGDISGVVIFGVSVFLFSAWASIFYIDFFYYAKLLDGAVDALVKIEEGSEGKIFLSTMIGEKFKGITSCRWRGAFFYLPTLIILAVGMIFSYQN